MRCKYIQTKKSALSIPIYTFVLKNLRVKLWCKLECSYCFVTKSAFDKQWTLNIEHKTFDKFVWHIHVSLECTGKCTIKYTASLFNPTINMFNSDSTISWGFDTFSFHKTWISIYSRFLPYKKIINASWKMSSCHHIVYLKLER